MTMILLEKATIYLINEKTILRHGGNFVPPFNLLNGSSLEYMLEAIDGEMFVQKFYPTMPDKAAFYMFQIVTSHIFQDGNKRTGLEAALLFLKFNNHRLNKQLQLVENQLNILIPSVGKTSN